MITNRIETFDRSRCRELREVIQQTLSEALAEYGVAVHLHNGSFTESNLMLKVEIAVIGEDGTVKSTDATAFERYAPQHGLLPTDLGRSFRFLGEVYEILGWKPRSYKFPILAKRQRDGKVFKFNPRDVKANLI